MTCTELHTALKNSYPAPNYTYLQEVRDATGFDAVRSVDAMAIGMYRSVGKLIHGFECKVTRSDWLKELSQPAKSESMMRYCDHWSLIASEESIVHAGELPPTWGFGVWHQSRKNASPKIRWVVRPPKLNPMPYSMTFLTAMIYAAKKSGDAVQDNKYTEGYAAGKSSVEEAAAKNIEKYERMKETVEKFARAAELGIDFMYTDAARIIERGKEFAAFRKTGVKEKELLRMFRNFQSQAEQILRVSKETIASCESTQISE